MVERAVSRAAGARDFLQRLAAGSGDAHAAQQSRSRGGGETRRFGGLRRDGQGGAKLGVLSRDGAFAEGAGSGRNAAGSVGKARGGVSYPWVRAACAGVQFQACVSLEQLG